MPKMLLAATSAALLAIRASAQAPDCASPAPTIAAAPVPASSSLRATIPIEINNNHVFVPVCLGGRSLSFILDTGAPFSVLDMSVARQLSVGLKDQFGITGVGAGSAAAATIKGVTVTLAGTSITNSPTRAIDFASVSRRDGHRFDGLLGGDLVDRYVLRIDYAARVLELHDRDRFRYEGGGAVVPISIRNGYPFADAEVTFADGGRATGTFLIDVGAARTVNFSKRWIAANRVRDRVSPTMRVRGGSGVGGAVTHDVGRVPSMRLGGALIAGPIVHLYGDSAGVFSTEDNAGSIGGDVLRRFSVILDYKRRRMILERHAGSDEPFETDMSGLNLSLDSSLSRIVVDDVLPDTPGMMAGLTAGDTIVAVNGESASTLMLDRLRTLFGKRDQPVELTVQRGGESTRRLVTPRSVVPPPAD